MTTSSGEARPQTPAQAWALMSQGNARFARGVSAHPHQSIQTRESLALSQNPYAALFGCADSRVGAEIIFDQGLGDLFVVRTAGHVVDPGVLGSLEFAVGVLHTPLIVVLAHTSCGAVRATLDALRTHAIPQGFLRDIVERIAPSVLAAEALGETSADDIGIIHLRHTVSLLAERSSLIRHRIEDGQLAVVGAEYGLAKGRADVITVLGDIGAPEADRTVTS